MEKNIRNVLKLVVKFIGYSMKNVKVYDLLKLYFDKLIDLLKIGEYDYLLKIMELICKINNYYDIDDFIKL